MGGNGSTVSSGSSQTERRKHHGETAQNWFYQSKQKRRNGMRALETVKASFLCMLIVGAFFILPGCGGSVGGGSWNEPTIPITPGAPVNITVTTTVPANTAIGVPIGGIITATFSGEMNSATINTTTFTVSHGDTAVAGTVTYSGVTAVFTPTSPLLPSTLYTATITTGAKSLAGSTLATNFVWTFTTGSSPGSLTVTTTVPANTAIGVPIGGIITATFSGEMNPATINTTTFTVSHGGTAVAGTVTYSGVTAVFTPTSPLLPSTLYTATITTGAKSLAGTTLATNFVWTFTTGNGSSPGAVNLGAVAPFGGFGGGAGMTNQGILTVINNGDIGTTGASTLITGFHDSTGDEYTQTPLNIGDVKGRIYTHAPPPVIFKPGGPYGGTAETALKADAAAADALKSFNYLAGLPGGAYAGSGELGGLTLTAGTYTSATTFKLTTGDLTLSGTANDLFIFQVGTGLTVGSPGVPRSVNLIGGALAKNVFWVVGSAARIEDKCTMAGTIIAKAGVTISTAGQLATTTLNGRALGLNASVTLVNTVINVPAP
jgi:hypothetical protein